MKKLLVEGGGDMPIEGAKRFHEWMVSGQLQSRDKESDSSTSTSLNMVLIPWASERTHKELIDDFCQWMSFPKCEELNQSGVYIIESSGKRMISMAPTMDEMLERKDSLVTLNEILRNASGIFFCGGDQSNITKVIYAIDGLKALLEDLYEMGIPFAGTSAGCAVMSKTMLTGEGRVDVIDPVQVETISGLGFVKNAVLDQHFVRRQRLNRLISVLLGSKEVYGIGIDEEMAVAITDDHHCEVLGSESCVILLEKPDESSLTTQGNFSMKILHSGDKFDICRTPLVDT